MRKNIGVVLCAAINGKRAQGDSKRTCWTDGAIVFSYHMPIARVVRRPTAKRKGIVEIVEYGRAPSKTTRSQVDAARYMFKYQLEGLYAVRFVQAVSI